jgi:hypothetical protein
MLSENEDTVNAAPSLGVVIGRRLESSIFD